MELNGWQICWLCFKYWGFTVFNQIYPSSFLDNVASTPTSMWSNPGVEPQSIDFAVRCQLAPTTLLAASSKNSNCVKWKSVCFRSILRIAQFFGSLTKLAFFSIHLKSASFNLRFKFCIIGRGCKTPGKAAVAPTTQQRQPNMDFETSKRIAGSVQSRL